MPRPTKSKGRDMQALVLKGGLSSLAQFTRGFLKEFPDSEAYDGDSIRQVLGKWLEAADALGRYLDERAGG
jgi:hypothetical protein